MKWNEIWQNFGRKFGCFLALLVFGISFSQVLSSHLSKNRVQLGEVVQLQISINNLQSKNIVAAPKNKLLPYHFEVLKDDISQGKDLYSRNIDFQIFDEGTYTIPELEFLIDGVPQKTIPYTIDVYNSAQASDQLNDIMNNKEVKLTWNDYWQMYKWYVLGILGIIALIILIIAFLKYVKRPKNTPKEQTNQTLKELEVLRKKKYIEQGDYRSFYVELIDITRNFITKQYRIPADVLLTDDLIEVMKKNNAISQGNEEIIEKIFLRGDLVKFAKVFPNKEMMEIDFEQIKTVVKQSTQEIEAELLRTGV